MYDNLKPESGFGRAFGSTERFKYYPRHDCKSLNKIFLRSDFK
jgi:hypothetical protein